MPRRRTIEFWCAVSLCWLLAAAGGLRAAGPADGQAAYSPTAEGLDDLLKSGRFQDFVAAAAALPADASTSAKVARLRIEGLLATGQNRAAEQSAQRTLAAGADPGILKLWLTARWRQGRGLDESPVPVPADAGARRDSHGAAQPPGSNAAATVVQFWKQALGGADPYRLAAGSRSAVLPLIAGGASHSTEPAAAGSARLGLPAIPLDVNGVRLARAFVDTGAQHTLLTPAAAAAAGVEAGPDGVDLVGFSSFPARPAVVRRLRLGNVVLHDVPVYVADSPPLAQAGGQASLGIDLLYHLRVVMDYPRQQAIVAPAVLDGATREPAGGAANGTQHAGWEIPLWTFSSACLAQGRMADGSIARTLIDTGNSQGTYLSSRWASRRLPDCQPFKHWFLLRQRMGRFSLARWQLGGEELADWPVRGTLPSQLERLDLVDLLVGQDLLARYRVEIDLAGRRLRLEAEE